MILVELFSVFLLIGAMTFGGGYSVLPLIDQLVIQQKGWLTTSETADIVSISEMSPGPFALNCSSFVGMKVAGFPGAVAATFGFLLLPMVIVLLLGFLYKRFRSISNVGKVFAVLNACIIGILSYSAIHLFMNSVFAGAQFGGRVDILALAVFLASFLMIFRLKFNPVLVIFISAAAGAVLYPVFPV